jgi:hypothetical protein
MNEVVRSSWGTTIFCDDIRAEIGGKITFVGVYASEMEVHVPFPFTMPKFGLWIRYLERPNTLSGDGKLYVLLPGDEKATVEVDVPMDQLRANPPATSTPEEMDEDAIMMQIPILLSPLVLKEPGRIRVRMHVGEKITALGSLGIKEAATPMAMSRGFVENGEGDVAIGTLRRLGLLSKGVIV